LVIARCVGAIAGHVSNRKLRLTAILVGDNPAKTREVKMRASSSAAVEQLAQFHSEPRFDAKRAVRSLDSVRAFSEKQTEPASRASTEVSFGRFRLFPTQFLLLEDHKPMVLGSRALALLIALLERRGEVVSKQDLMARVWPNLFVEPANLTVHICALRRALRDGQDGNRFIINITGRGYCFVAPVDVSRREN
jgi:DNA-binding winged helix-turn-helix (wHTH) protein